MYGRPASDYLARMSSKKKAKPSKEEKTAKPAAAAKAKPAKPANAAKAAKAKPAKTKPAKTKPAPKDAPAKAAPAKGAKAKPAKGKAAKAKRPRRKHADDYVTIGITPPELADGTNAFELNARLADMESRPDPALVAKAPWLNQERAYRAGYYLLTHGLREAAGHPEIEICNVPGAMLGSAHDLLTALADYALNEGAFAHGEAMMVTERPLSVIGFLAIAPGERGTDHETEVLRVVFLR
jgi:hypothetical protein